MPHDRNCQITESGTVRLGHGSGGRLSRELLEGLILPALGEAGPERLEDGAVFVPPPGDWIAVSWSWSQTNGQPSASLQKYPTSCEPSQASAPMNPHSARKLLPGSMTQNSFPSGSASTT